MKRCPFEVTPVKPKRPEPRLREAIFPIIFRTGAEFHIAIGMALLIAFMARVTGDDSMRTRQSTSPGATMCSSVRDDQLSWIGDKVDPDVPSPNQREHAKLGCEVS